MQPYLNQNPIYNERDHDHHHHHDQHHDHHHKCRKHLYQFIQVELTDGTIYQGILHSYDREKMYLLMPKTHHQHHITITMSPCIWKMRAAVADSSFLLDHLDCLAFHSLESEDSTIFPVLYLKITKRLADYILQVFFDLNLE